jgi:DNA segregation ATPase FtsK/SpoIIIE-like protein
MSTAEQAEAAQRARAAAAVRKAGEASIAVLREAMPIGHNSAIALLEHLEAEGTIGPRREDGTHEVLLP